MDENQDLEMSLKLDVNRKKMEEMLNSRGELNSSIPAKIFFDQVMAETNTVVNYPSSLKPNPKYKNDPYVIIVGSPKSVAAAKQKILECLDHKDVKVTMKIDIDRSAHRHIIGRSGENIKKIVEFTGCHVHCLAGNNNFKSNKVSISGDPIPVEITRCIIRAFLPVVIRFHVPHTCDFPSIVGQLFKLKDLGNKYGIDISCLKENTDFIIIVRCTQSNFRRHREGILLLLRLLYPLRIPALPACISLQVSQPKEYFFDKRNRIKICQIMRHTDTKITLPEDWAVNECVLKVFGCLDNTVTAWQELMKVLPCTVIFNVSKEREIDQDGVDICLKNNIAMSINVKLNKNIKTVVLESSEQKSSKMLNMCQRLLHLNCLNFEPLESVLHRFDDFLSAQEHLHKNSNSSTSASVQSNSMSFEGNCNMLELCACSANYSSPNIAIGGKDNADSETDDPMLLISSYEQKKLLASKAMQRCINSEEPAQTPCNMWSGYGFSLSSPKVSLKQNEISASASNFVNSGGMTSNQSLSLLCSGTNKVASEASLHCHDKSNYQRNFSYSSNFATSVPVQFSEIYDLSQVLYLNGMANYIDIFQAEEIDLPVFITLQNNDFQNLGIGYTARQKLNWIISGIKSYYSIHHTASDAWI